MANNYRPPINQIKADNIGSVAVFNKPSVWAYQKFLKESVPIIAGPIRSLFGTDLDTWVNYEVKVFELGLRKQISFGELSLSKIEKRSMVLLRTIAARRANDPIPSSSSITLYSLKSKNPVMSWVNRKPVDHQTPFFIPPAHWGSLSYLSDRPPLIERPIKADELPPMTLEDYKNAV